MITWKEYEQSNLTNASNDLQPVLDWLNSKSVLQPYPSIAVRLPDFWWFLRRHHYGRSGHGYSCPLSYTISLWIARLQGNQAYWIADLPAWLEHDSGLYDPAVPIIINSNGVRRVISRSWFKYTAPIELWLDRQFNRFNHWLYQRIGKVIQRKPLGQAIDNSRWFQQ
jgi:hypothetical protein